MSFSGHQQLEFRRKFWQFFGASIFVSDPGTGEELGFIEQKKFKLKEDIRVYTDRTKSQEQMQIRARSVIDFGATYDIIDPASGQAWMSMRRKGLRSTFVRDHWLLLDAAGNQFGELTETSGTLAIMRRWLDIIPFVGEILSLVFAFIPQEYTMYIGAPGAPATVAAVLTHKKNPLVVKLLLDFSTAQKQVDPRIGAAAASLLAVIDAAKNS